MTLKDGIELSKVCSDHSSNCTDMFFFESNLIGVCFICQAMNFGEKMRAGLQSSVVAAYRCSGAVVAFEHTDIFPHVDPEKAYLNFMRFAFSPNPPFSSQHFFVFVLFAAAHILALRNTQRSSRRTKRF